MTADQIIKLYNMKPLPEEGGFYVEIYRSEEKIPNSALPARYSGDRNHGTSILYLITRSSFSRLHKVKSDEVFHFYLGDAVIMLQLLADGSSRVIELGHDIAMGQKSQVIVPHGVWQGCLLKDEGEFALMGCSVTPGFEFEDYKSADRDSLLARYKDQREMIIKLTSSSPSVT